VAEVGVGKAGIVLGLEVSRLARNNTDWHRLLEICALTDTLILDEDGIYDPSHFNDRLLLGLKGTMSEAELHVLKARLQGGILNKARRGGVTQSLTLPLPLGAPELRKTGEDVIREVDLLLDNHTETEIAPILNRMGLRSGSGQPFTMMSVHNIRRNYGLKSHFQRLRDKGLLTIEEIAERLGIAPCVVKTWRDKGLLQAHRYNDRDECLYEPPAC